MKRQMSIPLLLIAATMFAHGLSSGCGSTPYRYTKNDPYRVFGACPNTGETDLSYITFAAVVLSLSELGWTVENIEKQGGDTRAKKCHVGNCLTLIFKPYKDGKVSTFTPEDAPMKVHMADDARRWTDDFEVPFSKYRCYTREAIEQEMSKYNFAF